MKRIRKIASWGLVGTCIFVGSTVEAEIKFERLGYLPGPELNSRATAVSSRGSVVVGESVIDDFYNNEGFHWRYGTMTGLGFLTGDNQSVAHAVSANGRIIVGNSLSTSTYEQRAFRWENGIMEELPALEANDISADGSIIVGSYNNGIWLGPEAYRWTAEGLVGIGDLDGGYDYSIAHAISADGSTIVGTGHESGGIGASGTKAFRWPVYPPVGDEVFMESLGSLGEGGASEAYGVSGDGSVIVGSSDFTAFRWEDEDMQPLAPLPGNSGFAESVAFDVSGDGSVVIGYSTSNDVATGQEAVFWSEANGYAPVSLNDFLDSHNIDRQGFVLSNAQGITPNGVTIVGTGYDTNDWTVEAYLVTIVDSWGSFRIVDNQVDTIDWMGKLGVGHYPWIWCYWTGSYIYLPEQVAQEGDGWVYSPDSDPMEITMVPGTDYGYSHGLKKWVFVDQDATDQVYMLSGDF